MSGNLKRYSVFHVFVLSFFSKKLYVDIARNWKGLNFLYLLMLLAICWIPPMIELQMGFNNFMKNEAPLVLDQIPEITLNDGRISIKEEQPYFISDPESGVPYVVIDTTGKIKSLDDTDAFVLLTEDKVFSRKNKFESRTYDLSNIKEFFVVDGEKITGWLNIGKKYLVPVIYPIAVSGSYVYRIIQALIYAAIGLLFAKICKARLSYGTLVRLAIAAVTPCIIVGTLFAFIGFSLPGIVYLLAALGYLFFAVASSSGQEDEEDDEMEGQVVIPEATFRVD